MLYRMVASRDPDNSKRPAKDDPTPSPTPSPTSSTSSTGGGWWIGVLVPLRFFVGVFFAVCLFKLCYKEQRIPSKARGRFATQRNNTDIAAGVSVAATSGATDGAATGATAASPAPPVLAAVDRVGAGATAVVTTALPASSLVAGGGYAARSEFHAVLVNAGQPLPTAVAVPYGTGSELAPV